MRVLNLYAGIGGNRKLWSDVEVTAIEWDPKIAQIYKELYPDDKILIRDAHKFLLEHFREFDFIWASPPCPTHSVLRHLIHAGKNQKYEYPDMRLYQEIILLKHWFQGLYCIENVSSYYDPLIKPQILDRHYFWSNFHISPFKHKKGFNIANTYNTSEDIIETLENYHNIKLPWKTPNMERIIRNCVYPPLGKHILDCARGTIQQKLIYDIKGIM